MHHHPFRRRTLSDLLVANLARPDPAPGPPVNLLRDMLQQPDPAPDLDATLEAEYERWVALRRISWDDRL